MLEVVVGLIASFLCSFDSPLHASAVPILLHSADRVSLKLQCQPHVPFLYLLDVFI